MNKTKRGDYFFILRLLKFSSVKVMFFPEEQTVLSRLIEVSLNENLAGHNLLFDWMQEHSTFFILLA